MALSTKSINCPYCKEVITAAKGLVRCKSCRAFMHQGCWESNAGCTTFGCQGKTFLSYSGRLGRFGQWPLNGVIIFIGVMSALLTVGLLDIQWLGIALLSAAAFTSSYLFYISFRDPDRNHLTRWMYDSCEKQSFYGAEYLMIMAFMLFIAGIAGLIWLVIKSDLV